MSVYSRKRDKLEDDKLSPFKEPFFLNFGLVLEEKWKNCAVCVYVMAPHPFDNGKMSSHNISLTLAMSLSSGETHSVLKFFTAMSSSYKAYPVLLSNRM